MTQTTEHALEAWKTFVSTGEILQDKVRPDIALSWKRCRNAGLNPWSSDFAKENTALLREKRLRYKPSLAATQPVMRFLKVLLGCNVSLMDGENFVFELLSPLNTYSRTLGTFMREAEVGTGNATLVCSEKEPVRIDGFEHYRAIAQSYSGVAAPYLDSKGHYFGALNFNSPFGFLPPSALDLCVQGVELTKALYDMGPRAQLALSTVDFFKPLLSLYEGPVVALDGKGRILLANMAMRPYMPDWDKYPYGTQSLAAYLGASSALGQLLELPERMEEPAAVTFKPKRSRGSSELSLVRHGKVEIEGADPFLLFVFEGPAARDEEAASPARKASKAVAKAAKRREAEFMPLGEGEVDYIGESDEWKAVDRLVQKVSPVKTNVLLLGETGTGKEVVARALHRRSGRPGAFVAVNCGAVPRDLLATELFGYEGGAFTGAREEGAVGKFEFADGGTLFLDEIGEMPVDMQVSLLRVLQESSVTKLGSNDTKPLDLRVVAATNQNIQRLIAEKKFRSDLYYRLSMVEIHLPQLRRRLDDVPLLVEYFNARLSQQLNVPLSPFPGATIRALQSYSWPGNVRELRNVVERCLIMEGEGANVGVSALPIYIAGGTNQGPDGPASARVPVDDDRLEGLRLFEARARLRELVGRFDGNVSKVAAHLGVDDDGMRELLDRLGMKARIVLDEDDDISAFVRF